MLLTHRLQFLWVQCEPELQAATGMDLLVEFRGNAQTALKYLYS